MMFKSINLPAFIFLLSSIFLSCGDRNLGTPTGIFVKPATDAHINYGRTFVVETYMTYSSGQKKLLNSKRDVHFVVKGGEVHGDEITLSSYPTSFKADTVYVYAKYDKKDLTFETNTAIPFNYFGDLNLEFNGDAGTEGTDGSNGRTALLFRHGKDGDDGLEGGAGNPGHDLSILVYKVEKSGLYHIRVMDVTTSKFYYYRSKDTGYPIKIYVTGGNGGPGGDGGNGGDGKDGEVKDDKTKDAGAGGNGGIGGNGGPGGNGGTVYLFVHPSADGIQKRITVYNLGGSGGEAGKGGKAGEAGDALDGQEQPADGLAGAPGIEGPMGNPGQPIQVSVEDFDIDF